MYYYGGVIFILPLSSHKDKEVITLHPTIIMVIYIREVIQL